MFIVLVIATAVIIGIATYHTWRVSRDALAPLVVFFPMLTYVYVYSPLAIYANDGWIAYPKVADQVEFVAFVNLLFLSAFTIGATSMSRTFATTARPILLQQFATSQSMRQKLQNAGLSLGLAGVLAFCYTMYVSGGLTQVFSKGKPFLSTASGYIGELPNLTFPSLVLLALAWQGQPLRLNRLLIALAMASPHLLMGTLGGRRGPAFLIGVTLVTCYLLIRRIQPSLLFVYIGILLSGFLLFFLLTQRSSIYLGSNFEFDLVETIDATSVRNVGDGHETLVAAAGIAVSRKTERHFWGGRYLVMTFVRPIPRQIWPSKYIDTGMEWMETMPGSFGFDDSTWYSQVGFIPFRGNSTGFVTDLYIEFGLLGCVFAFLIGFAYRRVWEQARLAGGSWTLLYVILLAMTVYLPSQTVQAWWVRTLICALPSLLYWHYLIQPLTPFRQQPHWKHSGAA